MGKIKVSFISSSKLGRGVVSELWLAGDSFDSVKMSPVADVVTESDYDSIHDDIESFMKQRRNLGVDRSFQGYDLFEVERHHLRMALMVHFQKVFAVTKILNQVDATSLDDVRIIGDNADLSRIVNSYFGNSKASRGLPGIGNRLMGYVNVVIHGLGRLVRSLPHFLDSKERSYSHAFFNMPMSRYSPLMKAGDERGYGFFAQGSRQAKEYRQFGISDSLLHWFRPVDFLSAFRFVDDTCQTLSELLAAPDCSEVHRYRGVSLLETFYPQWVGYFYRRHFQYLFELLAFERWVEARKVSKLVLWNDELASEKCLLLLSKKLKIDTYVVLHGALEGFLSSNPELVDYYIVWGRITRDQFVDIGYQDGQVLSLGCVQFDDLFHQKVSLAEKGRKALCRELGLDSDAQYIMCPMLPGPDGHGKSALKKGQEVDYLRRVLAAVKAVSGFRLLLKCRNSEDRQYFQKLVELEETKVKCEFFDSVSIPELLFVSDMLVSYPSTIVVESLLMEKYSVVVELEGHVIQTPYEQYEAVQVVGTTPDLEAAIESFNGKNSVGKGAQRFVEDFVGEFDGKRADVVLSTISESP